MKHERGGRQKRKKELKRTRFNLVLNPPRGGKK